jgi:hypothetical protein
MRGMKTDPDIAAIARAALVEFGSKAVDIMDLRAKAHELAAEHESAEFWRRVAASVREMSGKMSP